MKSVFTTKFRAFLFLFLSQVFFASGVYAQLSVTVTADDNLVCVNQTTQLHVEVTGGGGDLSYFWVGTPGNFTSTQEEPIVTPLQTTLYTVTVSDGTNIATGQVEVRVIPMPVANAGEDDAICETDNQITIEGTATDAWSVTWQCVNGNGGYFEGHTNDSLTAIYHMSEQEKEGGFLRFRLYAYSSPPCNIQNYDVDEVTFTIANAPTVSTGADARVCEGENYTLNGATAQDYGSLVWTSSGTGQFTDSHILNPTYIPSTADYQSGQVTLTLRAEAASPCDDGDDVSDMMDLTFASSPDVNAGEDVVVCEDEQVFLNPQVFFATQVLWSTDGSGNFQNPTSANATYYPSPQDIANGQVTLTLTASGDELCADVSDEIVVTINNFPTVNAGDDEVVCESGVVNLVGVATDYNFVQWNSLGDGSFNTPNELNTTYTPGASDAANGFVDLVFRASATSPCSATVYDTLRVTIQPIVTVDAGDTYNTCTNIPVELSAVVEGASEVLWTTNGDGVFSDETSVESTYTPGAQDMANGSVNLVITASSVSPCTETVSDDVLIVYTPGPVAMAGEDDQVCDNLPYQLSGVVDGLIDSHVWTSSGDGSFDDATLVNASYMPGPQDVESGSVELTLTVSSDECGDDTDKVVLTYQHNPEIQILAADTTTLCEEVTVQLEITADNYGSLNWATSGDGSFDEDNTLNPVYTLGAQDIENGTVRIIAAAYALLPCDTPARDTIYLEYYAAPQVSVGNDTTVCSQDGIDLNATASNYESVYWFIVDGTGEFDDSSSLETNYQFSDLDVTNGEVTLKLVAYSGGECEAVEDEIVITIQGSPYAYVGPDAAVCEGESFDLDAIVQYSGGVGWGSSGDGTFSDLSSVATTYTPGPNDIETGEVDLFIAAYALLPCDQPYYDTLTLSVIGSPSVEAGEQVDLCVGEKVELNPTVSNYGSILWTSPGDGVFDDSTAVNAVYTPGVEDIQNGVVWLTINVEPQSPCTETVSDDLIVVFKETPVFDLGENIDTNYYSQVSFNPVVTGGSGMYSYQWTPSELFVDPSVLDAQTVQLTEEMGNYHTVYLSVSDGQSGCVTTDSVMIGLELGPVHAEIVADPPYICKGASSQLTVVASGGTDNFFYNWTSLPLGFTASTETVTVTPDENTKYIVSVTDGFSYYFDTIEMVIQPSPGALTIQGKYNVYTNAREAYTVTYHDNWIYEWGIINGAVSTGQYSSDVVVNWGESGTGELWVIPTNQYGCVGVKSSMDVTISESNIGFGEIDEIDELKIYPNPFEDNFSIDYELNEESDIYIRLYNSLGQLIYTDEKMNQAEGKHRVRINENDLNNHTGVIFVRLEVNKKAVVTKMIRMN